MTGGDCLAVEVPDSKSADHARRPQEPIYKMVPLGLIMDWLDQIGQQRQLPLSRHPPRHALARCGSSLGVDGNMEWVIGKMPQNSCVNCFGMME